MTNLIIAFTFTFILYEITLLFRARHYDTIMVKISNDLHKGVLDKNDRSLVIFNVFYFFYAVLGLFTPYWLFFSLVLFLSSLAVQIDKKITTQSKRILRRRLDSLVMIILYLGLLYYHFKIK